MCRHLPLSKLYRHSKWSNSPWPWQSTFMLKLDLVEWCNEAEITLLTWKKYWNVYKTSRNLYCGYKFEVERSKASSNKGLRKTQALFSMLFSTMSHKFLILYIWAVKSSIYAVDRCSDHISMWLTRFRHIWLISDGISILNRNTKCNIHCVKSVSHHTTYCCRYIWYNRRSEFLIHKDYSYNDDYPCLCDIHSDYSCNDYTCNHLNDRV